MDVIVGRRDKEGLEPSEVTISGLMKNAGYKTAIFGKWHCGTDLRHNPTNHGFDEFVGLLKGAGDYHKHSNWMDGTQIKEQKGYSTHIITERSVDFIIRNKDNPFFLYVSHAAVHNPHQTPADTPRQRKFDGISIKDHLLNQADVPDRCVFFGYEPKPGTAMCDGNWKMQTKGDVVELYDLSKDIKETTNVAHRYPRRTAEMKAAIEKWKLEVMPETTSQR